MTARSARSLGWVVVLSGCNALLGIDDPPPFDGGTGGAAGSSTATDPSSGTGAAPSTTSGASTTTGAGGGEGGSLPCVPIAETSQIIDADVYIPGRPRRVGETSIDAFVLFDVSTDGGTVAQVLYSALDSGAVTQCVVDGEATAADDSLGFLAELDDDTYYVPAGEPHLLSVPSEQCSGFGDTDILAAHVGAAALGGELFSVDGAKGSIRTLRPFGAEPLSGPPQGRRVPMDVEVAGGRLLIAYRSTEEDGPGCLGAFELGGEAPAICVPGSRGDVRAVAASVQQDPFILVADGDSARVVRVTDGSCWESDHPDAMGFDVDDTYLYIPLSDGLQICSLEGDGCRRVAAAEGAGAVSDVRVTPSGAFFAQDEDDGTGIFARVVADELFAE